MRLVHLVLVGACPLVAAACATLIGFPDVPGVDDGGAEADPGAGPDGNGSGVGSSGVPASNSQSDGSPANAGDSGAGLTSSASSGAARPNGGSGGSASDSGAFGSGSSGGSAGAGTAGSSGDASSGGSGSSTGAGSDGGSSASSSGGSSGSSDDSGFDDSGSSSGGQGVCTPGSTQCSGASGVAICGAAGQWGAVWPCTSGTCSNGACVGATTTGASCQTGGAAPIDCGATHESCCTSLEVPGGIYYRTYANTGSGPTGESDPAVVSGFRLDKYLVTVGRFRQFVNATLPPDGGAGWLPLLGSGKHAHLNGGSGLNATAGGYEPGWVGGDDSNIAPADINLACSPSFSSWTSAPGTQETLPINCVNWYEAYAFCIWDGGFLPSEAEWEYATAGGSQQREFPWGSTDPGTNNEYAIYGYGAGCYYPSSGTCTGLVNVAPVGTPTLGAGLWAQLDLAGEVDEWILDSYAAYVDPCTDCADTAPAAYRVIRGSGFSTALLVTGYRATPTAPMNRSPGVGFRCARTP
jgi:formylglycine-generating enzyme